MADCTKAPLVRGTPSTGLAVAQSSAKLKVVQVPPTRHPVRKSPGFAKKHLSDYALDLLALCGYGCRYCSSNAGNYLRINRGRFAELTEAQLGEKLLPAEAPELTFVWPQILDQLQAQLANKPAAWGEGKTLVVSMLTDAFSPHLVADGTTRRALELVLAHTSFRIRVLTKNACVGSRQWLDFFAQYPDRFVVGLSIGSLDDRWAKKVEVATSPPSARIKAHRRLQEAAIPTYAMMCPVFPDVLDGDGLEDLIGRLRPELCEHVWAEPYNDRDNWKHVRDGYPADTSGHRLLTEAFGHGHSRIWSGYASGLYCRLRRHAERHGWLPRLRYLLYEGRVASADVNIFDGLPGVLLQDKPKDDGTSRHEAFAALQRAVLREQGR